VKARFLVVTFGVYALDQWTKLWIEGSLGLYDRLAVLPGFFDLVHVQNTGIAFGLFPAGRALGGTVVLAALGFLALAVVSVYFHRTSEKEPLLLLALALVLGGAIGNLTDRVLLRAVTDFLDVYLGEHHWPAFNVADSAVSVGLVLMLLHGFVPALSARGREARAARTGRAGAGSSKWPASRRRLQRPAGESIATWRGSSVSPAAGFRDSCGADS